ncbi:MAG: hypothetical protein JW832_09225 [Deltaproteobacteria bacterium]|nr:hypothetical protein [Deltaproteobacteria bacterium]
MQTLLPSPETDPACCRNYRIAGLTLRVTADLPLDSAAFEEKFSCFQTDEPGNDVIYLHHHFFIPDMRDENPGRMVFRKGPWTIYQRDSTWIYHAPTLGQLAVCNKTHTRCAMYHEPQEADRIGHDTLSLLPSDQILLARLLPERQACLIHAAGMALAGQGLLFLGHSGAGKSTVAQLLARRGTVLCDDRIIVRRWPEGLRIHGTWFHSAGVPLVSPADAPLRALLLLEKSDANRLEPVRDRAELARTLPLFIIKSLLTADWWEKVFDLMTRVIREVPAYRLYFDTSGSVAAALEPLLQEGG